MAEQNTSRIQVLDRAIHILEAMARYSKPVKLKIMSAETGLHPSTVHRILHVHTWKGCAIASARLST